MAIRGMEGWDSIYIGDTTDYWQGYDATNSSIVQGAGRCSSAAFRNTSAGGNGPFIGVNATTDGGFLGYAYSPEAYGPGAQITIDSVSGILAFLTFPADGSVGVWKGPNTILGTSMGSTAAGFVSTGHYTHIGWEWFFHATLGYFRIYVDANLAFDTGNVDTLNNGYTFGSWATLYWKPKGYIDDLYWGDTDASDLDNPEVSFLGDLRVEEQVYLTDAIGGGGFYRQFTPSAGTDHGALLNEIPPDDGATYVESSTIGQKETGKFANVSPTSGTIYAVQLMPNMVKSVAGGRQISTLVRSGGSDAVGNPQSIAQTNFRYYPQVYGRNPIGSVPWTVASVNAMEGGVEITA